MGKIPGYVFINFSAGGAPAGLTQGIFTTVIEQATNTALCDLVDAGHAASAGTGIGVPLFLRDKMHSDLPQLTAQEGSDLFKRNATLWLNKRIPYIRQHMRSLHLPFFKSATADGFYLDEKIVEAALELHLEGATVKDLCKTFTISAHKISASSPREEAVMLGRTSDKFGNIHYAPDGKTKLSDIMRASMAVPGHYKSKHIKGAGDLSDFGHIYDAHLALADFKNSVPAGAPVHFIELGGPRHYGHLSAAQLDQCGLLGLILNAHLMRGTSNHSYSVGMQVVEHLIGDKGKIFDLTPTIHDKDLGIGRKPSENILDVTPDNIQRIEDFAHSYLEKNAEGFKKMCDLLIENKIAREKPLPDLPPALAIKKPQPGFLSGVRSFWKPVEPSVSLH